MEDRGLSNPALAVQDNEVVLLAVNEGLLDGTEDVVVAKEQLPDTLNAILRIAVLPNGHLAVMRITGLESIEIDVFDRNGHFIYSILPSAEIPDLRDVIIFENTIGIITELEEKNIFIEYRVKNMKGIFDLT